MSRSGGNDSLESSEKRKRRKLFRIFAKTFCREINIVFFSFKKRKWKLCNWAEQLGDSCELHTIQYIELADADDDDDDDDNNDDDDEESKDGD